jgi:hypothetical protein
MNIEYIRRKDNKLSFKNIFKKFTDVVGGDLDEFADIVYSRYTIEDFSYHDDLIYWNVVSYFEKNVIPHKIAVYQAALELSRMEFFKGYGVGHTEFLGNAWLHDISKFSANEAQGYALYDFKANKKSMPFDYAWNHHKNHNPHHPEYWMNVNKEGISEPLPMPKIYVLEMVADWIGAGKTYGITLEEWLPKNIGKFKFHESTAIYLHTILFNMGFNNRNEILDADIWLRGVLKSKNLV